MCLSPPDKTEGLSFFTGCLILILMERIKILNPFNNSPVYHFTETTSTMEEARKLIPLGPPTGTVLWADFQSAGRGRGRGRSWQSEPGKNLLFTLIYRKEDFPYSAQLFPLLSGLGIALFCREQNISAKIKWPNDVLWQGRKLAGILCEAAEKYLLAGIGLNCGQDSFYGPLRRPPVSLSFLKNKDVKPESILPCLLKKLKEAYTEPDWKEPLESFLYLKGEKINFKAGSTESYELVSGTLVGIGPSGEILIQPPGPFSDLQGFFSGEIEEAEG